MSHSHVAATVAGMGVPSRACTGRDFHTDPNGLATRYGNVSPFHNSPLDTRTGSRSILRIDLCEQEDDARDDCGHSD